MRPCFAPFTTLCIVLIVCAACCTGCIAGGGDAPPDVSRTPRETALQFTDALFANDHAAASLLMTTEMQGVLTPLALAATVQQLSTLYGAFEDYSGTEETNGDWYDVVYVTCAHASGTEVMYRVVIEGDLVAGFFIEEARVPYTPPPYADLESLTETEIVFGAPGWELTGTLTMPLGDGPFPAVILVHGSGAHDRDASLGQNKPFKDLALGLASRGIAVLSYDKRTYLYGPEVVDAIETFTLEDETVDDAVMALSFLSTVEGINSSRLYVIGHSLGGYAAPLIACKAQQLAGLVLLAAPARPLEDLIVEQTRYLASVDGIVTDEEREGIAAAEAMAETIRTLSMADGEVVLGASRAYWAFLSVYDPVSLAACIGVPVLVLQGERDYQVAMEDYFLWQDGLGEGATFYSYPLLNHLFFEGDGFSTPDEYYRPSHVSSEIIDAIVLWCHAS